MSEKKLYADKISDDIDIQLHVYMVDTTAEIQISSSFDNVYTYTELKTIIEKLDRMASLIQGYKWRVENE
ncbi:MAG: hypothetical protein CL490_06335 [Acinetobacter sp.]|nr:hypothetical protein [Acinetobacter sp.]